MCEIFNKSICKFTKGLRRISQFKIPRTDCVDIKHRVVVNHRVCRSRDKGIVLGVYYNDNVAENRAILTTTAQKYNLSTKGKLWELLQLSPIPKLGESRVFFDVDPEFGYVAVAGLGSECLAYNSLEQMDESKEAIRTAAAVGAKALQVLNPTSIHVESFGDAEAAAEGAALATWVFQEYRTTEKLRLPRLYLYEDCDIDGWNVGKLKAEAQNLARYLQEMPANKLNPTTFAKIAVELLCELDINVEIKTKGWAISHEMGGFVAIGKSSVQPPLHVEISYYGADAEARPAVLVGKGVTFNSGSLTLKSPAELRYAKGDMAGAACVLAVTRAAALLRLPLNVRGILPLCELMPNGCSPRFGDVVSSADGSSIKSRLPSHAGRLLVADGLVRARHYWPRYVVDIGTMSCELASSLGPAACACYGNCERLIASAQAAGARTGDRVWHMPLWKFYTERITDCESADLANTARMPYGDSAHCAAFLGQFVRDNRWLHLDSYGVAYSRGYDTTYLRRGMTGRPTRTLLQLLCHDVVNSKKE